MAALPAACDGVKATTACCGSARRQLPGTGKPVPQTRLCVHLRKRRVTPLLEARPATLHGRGKGDRWVQVEPRQVRGPKVVGCWVMQPLAPPSGDG